MASVGIVSRDVVSKNRILEVLQEKKYDMTNINTNVFDGNAFDVIIVDLSDPIALLVLRTYAHKCIAFAASNDEERIKAAKMSGCERVHKHGEFFKKILPELKI